MKRLTGVLAFAGLAMLVALPAQASINLVTNGTFDPGSGNPYTPTESNGGFTTLNADVDAQAHAIPGWTVTSNSVDWIDGYWQAAPGCKYSIDMSGTLNPYEKNSAEGTLVAVRFATTVGTWYLVQFDMSGNPDSGPATKVLDVGVNGGSTTEFDYTLGPNNSKSNMLWATKSYWFKATATESELDFSSATPTQFGPTLDAVQSYAVTGDNSTVAVIPEPAAMVVWSLLGAAVAGLAVLRRRARRASPMT